MERLGVTGPVAPHRRIFRVRTVVTDVAEEVTVGVLPHGHPEAYFEGDLRYCGAVVTEVADRQTSDEHEPSPRVELIRPSFRPPAPTSGSGASSCRSSSASTLRRAGLVDDRGELGHFAVWTVRGSSSSFLPDVDTAPTAVSIHRRCTSCAARRRCTAWPRPADPALRRTGYSAVHHRHIRPLRPTTPTGCRDRRTHTLSCTAKQHVVEFSTSLASSSAAGPRYGRRAPLRSSRPRPRDDSASPARRAGEQHQLQWRVDDGEVGVARPEPWPGGAPNSFV